MPDTSADNCILHDTCLTHNTSANNCFLLDTHTHTPKTRMAHNATADNYFFGDTQHAWHTIPQLATFSSVTHTISTFIPVSVVFRIHAGMNYIFISQYIFHVYLYSNY